MRNGDSAPVAAEKSESDCAMMDHLRGCFICKTRSRRCSSSALAQALASAFLDLSRSFFELLGEEDLGVLVGAFGLELYGESDEGGGGGYG